MWVFGRGLFNCLWFARTVIEVRPDDWNARMYVWIAVKREFDVLRPVFKVGFYNVLHYSVMHLLY